MKKLVLPLVMMACASWGLAQTPGSVGPAPALADASKPPPPRPGATREELTLTQLRERLVLTPDQAGVWNAFAAKVEAYTEVYYREKPVLASQALSATQQIARLVDHQQNRLAALEEVEATTKALWATLNSSQQATANRYLLSTLPNPAPTVGGDSGGRPDRRKEGRPEGAHQRRGAMGGGAGG